MSEQSSRSILSRMGLRRRGADGAPSRRGATERLPEPAPLARELARIPVAEHDQLVLDTVRATVADVLGLGSAHDVGPDDLFAALGIDSLTAFALRNRLHELTELRLQATLVFDYPTPAAVAGFLRAELAEGANPSLQPLFAELDVLEGMFAVAVLDPESRARATTRLRELLSGITDAAPKLNEDASPDLDEATDDEVFDFIGKEFGIHSR
jgi:acyl carrier protein